jgi:transcriptional regulator with XRE-family HTH domain
MISEFVEPHVGPRVRALRKQQGLTLHMLAEQCGLSPTAISRIERGENSPTVSSLHRLATALRVPIVELFQEQTEQAIVITRRDRRRRSVSDGVMLESLGIGLPGQQLEPFVMTVQPGAASTAELISHLGEEFVHCLEGEIEYRVDDQVYRLEAGDSLLFEATQPHAYHNASHIPAIVLIVFQAGQNHDLARQHH